MSGAKAIVWAVVLVMAMTTIAAVAVVRNYSMPELALSIVKPESDALPAALSEYYLLRIKTWTPEDLEQSGTLPFVVNLMTEPGAHREAARQLAEKLIARGANVNRVDPATGYAPLHAAVLANSVSTVRFLLDHGADRTLRDAGHNRTALALARHLAEQSPLSLDRSAVITLLSKTPQGQPTTTNPGSSSRG